MLPLEIAGIIFVEKIQLIALLKHEKIKVIFFLSLEP
jgi:hypothetical protein